LRFVDEEWVDQVDLRRRVFPRGVRCASTSGGWQLFCSLRMMPGIGRQFFPFCEATFYLKLVACPADSVRVQGVLMKRKRLLRLQCFSSYGTLTDCPPSTPRPAIWSWFLHQIFEAHEDQSVSPSSGQKGGQRSLAALILSFLAGRVLAGFCHQPILPSRCTEPAPGALRGRCGRIAPNSAPHRPRHSVATPFCTKEWPVSAMSNVVCASFLPSLL